MPAQLVGDLDPIHDFLGEALEVSRFGFGVGAVRVAGPGTALHLVPYLVQVC